MQMDRDPSPNSRTRLEPARPHTQPQLIPRPRTNPLIAYSGHRTRAVRTGLRRADLTEAPMVRSFAVPVRSNWNPLFQELLAIPLNRLNGQHRDAGNFKDDIYHLTRLDRQLYLRIYTVLVQPGHDLPVTATGQHRCKSASRRAPLSLALPSILRASPLLSTPRRCSYSAASVDQLGHPLCHGRGWRRRGERAGNPLRPIDQLAFRRLLLIEQEGLRP